MTVMTIPATKWFVDHKRMYESYEMDTRLRYIQIGSILDVAYYRTYW